MVNGSNWTSITEDLHRSFDSLDLDTMIGRALDYFSTKVSCQNIHWFLYSEAQNVLSTTDKKPQVTSSFDLKVLWQSQAEREFPTSVAQLRKFKKEVPDMDARGVNYLRDNGQDHALVPLFGLDNTGHPFAYLVFEDIDNLKFDVKEKLESVTRLASRHLNFCWEHYQSQQKSYIDDVTELYNQRYLHLVLEKEIKRSNRSKDPFTVLFLDVDHFKAVNDTRGHLVGSEALLEVGKLIKEEIRDNDYAFRYGGDEFLVLLVGSDAEASKSVAERIRKKVEKTTFKIKKEELNITVSVGLASFPDHAKSSEQVIEMADEAMYYAKNKSRNAVYVTAS